jgi:hypothetical protein
MPTKWSATASPDGRPPAKRWFLWFALACVAGIAILFAMFWALGGFEDMAMSGHGVVALAGTVVLVLVVGIGLMALVFYSNRSGRDEAVHHGGLDDDEADR